jgi:flagellar hook-associated protein 3 FlgL
MISLMDGLFNNESDTIGRSLNLMDSSLSRNLSAQATNGARANQYEIAQSRGGAKAIDLTDLQSKIEDVDFAEAITQLALQQAVYEASLQMGARALQQTLMDFI